MLGHFKFVYYLTHYVSNDKSLPLSMRFKRFLWVFLNHIIYPLRWKIAIKQPECLKKINSEKKGVLFLSNHSSNMDGNLIYIGFARHGCFLNIWAHDFVYKLPFIGTGISLIGNVKVPYLTNRRKKNDEMFVRKAIIRTVDGLKQGKNYMFFPSGHSKRTGKEIIRGKSALHSILKLMPDVPIVLIRHTGMWGSRFSWAYERPSYCKSEGQKWRLIFRDYFKMFFGNLFFFIPKRKFEVNLEMAPEDFPRHSSRKELNLWLERYFNQGYPEGESVAVVKDYFWLNKGIKHSFRIRKPHFDLGQISENVRTKVIEVISRKAKIAPEMIHENQILETDLHLDSLELIAILVELEKEFNHTPIILTHVTTVGHLMAILSEVPVEVKHELVSLDRK